MNKEKMVLSFNNKRMLTLFMTLLLALMKGSTAFGEGAGKQVPEKVIKRAISVLNKNLEEADSLSQKLLDIKEVYKNDTLLSKAYFLRGIVACQKDQYRISNNFYRQALQTSYGRKDQQFQAEIWNNTAINYQLNDQYDSAFKSYTKALYFKEQLSDTLSMANTLLNRAGLEANLGNYAECESLLNKVIPVFRRYKDTASIAYAYQNLGFNETQRGNNRKAIAYHQRSLALFKDITHYQGVLDEYLNLAARHQEIGEAKVALSYLDTLRTQLYTYARPPVAYKEKLMRIELYMQLDQSKKVKHLMAALSNHQSTLSQYGLLKDYYLVLMGWQAMQGNMNRFQVVRQKYRDHQDSLLRVRFQQNTAELKTLYQMDKQNALIAEKEKRIQVETQNNKKLLIAFAISLLLLSVLFILYLKNQRLGTIITNLNIAEMLPFAGKRGNGLIRGNKGKRPKTKKEELFEQIDRLVVEEEWYKDRSLTLKKLARELGTNELYVSQAINTLSGLNFNTYVNQYRIKEAKNLLLDPRQESPSILDISLKVGFSNPSTFSRTFKKLSGFSPSEYLKLHRGFSD